MKKGKTIKISNLGGILITVFVSLVSITTLVLASYTGPDRSYSWYTTSYERKQCHYTGIKDYPVKVIARVVITSMFPQVAAVPELIPPIHGFCLQLVWNMCHLWLNRNQLFLFNRVLFCFRHRCYCGPNTA